MPICLRKTTQNLNPFQTERETNTSLEDASNDDFIDSLLRNVVRRKIAMLYQERHQKTELEQLKIELRNAKQLESNLRTALLSSSTQFSTLQVACNLAEQSNHKFVNRVRSIEIELERKNSEILDLKELVCSKDKHLMERYVVYNDMKHQIEHMTTENRKLERRSTEQEIEINDLLEEIKQLKRTIEVLKYSVSFPQSVDSRKKSKSRIRVRRKLDLEEELPSSSSSLSDGLDLRKMEQIHMACEDLRSQNKHLIQRNKELVEAYWPLMSKIKRLDVQNNHE